MDSKTMYNIHDRKNIHILTYQTISMYQDIRYLIIEMFVQETIFPFLIFPRRLPMWFDLPLY